jgi:parallel beta-helix repeat protein
MVALSPLGGAAAQFLDNNGAILSGGKIYTYVAGTTTPQATYTSVSGATPHANPIVLDSAGRVPSGEIWLTSGAIYKFVIETALGVLLGTYDNISGINDLSAAGVNFTGFKGQSGTVEDLADNDGSDWIGFQQAGTSAVAISAQDKMRQSVSIKDFGAVGDGVADDTAAVQAANAASLTLVFPMNGVYNLTNWVPLAGTTIIADGATIQRGAITTYGATGSSAAIVIANSGIQIVGGKLTDKSGLTQATFSGAVLVDGGRNCALRNVELTGCWTGVFGNAAQNGTNLAENVTIDGCWFHDNQHNTYLADIDGLIITGSVFENANRDGLKTYRNTQALIIDGNIFRDNGDGTAAQSQNGLDLFIAGKTCIITNNLIYNNIYDAGVDIKRNASGSAEAVEDEKYIIANNMVYGNGLQGIMCEVSGIVGYIDNLTITNNHIYDNGDRGLFIKFARNCDISHNNIYNNVTDGIRVNDVDGVRIIGNCITNNAATGINVNSGNGVIVTANDVIGTVSQINGILIAPTVTDSKCYDNNARGHGTNYAISSSTLGVKGKIIDVKIANTTATQFVGFSQKGCVTAVELMLNNPATMDFTVSKRSATTGLFAANITSNIALSVPTAYVAVSPTMSGSTSQRIVVDNNALTVTLGNIASAFTDGHVRIHYID